MKHKRGTLQYGPLVKRVIYLSREASKALKELGARRIYTESEYVEILVLREFEKIQKIKATVEKILAKQTKNNRKK